MKTRLLLALVLVLTLAPVSAPASDVAPTATSGPVTKRYGTFTQEGFYWLGLASDRWDSVGCDLVISYTLDMSDHTPPMGQPVWSLVGVWDEERELGWLASGAPDAAVTDDKKLDLDDKLNLSAPPGRFDEYSYDATGPDTIGPPVGSSWPNYGIWFDRDGISPEEASRWDMRPGQTHTTGGEYEVVVTYHAISPTLGTMFATVNGIGTGFYETWKDGEPDYYPVGKSVSGDLGNLRAFVSLWGQNVSIADLTVSGCPWTRNYLPLVVCD